MVTDDDDDDDDDDVDDVDDDDEITSLQDIWLFLHSSREQIAIIVIAFHRNISFLLWIKKNVCFCQSTFGERRE